MDEKDELDAYYENEQMDELGDLEEFESSGEEEAPEDELENYVKNYDGQVRLDRLVSIFHSDSLFSMPALHLAISEAKADVNVENYVTLVSTLQSVAPDDPLATVDDAWVESTTKNAQAETSRLEQELKQYKNNLIKESIRMGNEDLGNHFLAIGSYPEAAKCYSRMREYCTTQKHLLEMNLKLLFVALIQQNWSVALTYRPKVVVPPSKDDPASQAVDALLNAVVGLAQLNLGHYRSAAEKFLSVNSVYIAATEIAGINFQRRVIAPSEIAIYGSLCALATMSVAELQSSVLENQQFREFMDLELDLGRAVSLFCGHRFTDCLAALDEYSAEYKMDLHLRNHFAALYSQIRSKSMARWFSVFSVVSFNTVQSVFPTKDGASLQEELEDMIESGKLNARIDVVDQLVVRNQSDSRLVMIEDAIATAKSYERNLRLQLLNINVQAAGLEVKAPPRGGPPPTAAFGPESSMDDGALYSALAASSSSGRRRHGAFAHMV